MSISPVAEALFRATKSRLTGKLMLRSGGRESVFGLHEGDLVAVEATFGFQGTAQSLLNAGRIDLSTLDALWARGDAGRMDAEELEDLGTPPSEAHELTVLANVRSVASLATEARFEETEVEPEFTPLKGARVVRAALEAAGGEVAGSVYRCEDPAACEPWLLDDGEKAFVDGLTVFRKPDAQSPSRRSLLQVLELDGKIERLDEETWRREEARQEEAARLRAEEEAARLRAEEEERWRQAEEARLRAEEEERRRQEEEARLRAEEEARLRAEEEERRRQEEEARLRAEEEERWRREEEARLRAEEEERRRREEEARLRAEEEERWRQEEEARLRAEEETLRLAEEARRRAAEAERLADAMRQAAESLGGTGFPAEVAATPEPGPAIPTPAPLPLITTPEFISPPPPEEGPPPVIQLTTEIDTSRTRTDLEFPAAGHPRFSAGSDTQKVKNPLAEQAPITEPRATLPTPPIPEGPALTSASREEEEQTMREARARAQQDVVRDVHEALRRAAASAGDDAWLSEPPPSSAAPPAGAEATPEWAHPPADSVPLLEVPPEAPLPEPDLQAALVGEATIELSPSEEASPSGEVPAAAPGQPPPLAPDPDSSWTLRPPPASQVPPTAPSPVPEGDLWKIVSFDQSPQAQLNSSFEEALRQVDAHLEKIVGLPVVTEPLPPLAPTLPVEALVEVPDPPPPVPGDNAPRTDETWDSSELDELEEFFGEDEDGVAGDPSDPVEAARLRRQRLLRRAMENLGAPLGPRPPGAPPTGAQPVTQPAIPAAAAPSGSRSEEEEKLAQQIQGRFKQLQSRPDHFTVLGLGREVGREAVKNAFLNLAKAFHPDRLPPSLQELAPQMTQVFESIREAYETLYDDAKRQSYLLTLQSTAAPASRSPGGPAAGPQSKAANDALELFKKGEVLFKKRDYLTAEDLYDKAYALDAKATYLAAKAWSIYMDPARKGDGARAKQLMQDAIRADPLCDRAHYQLGVIARVEGDMERAERHFREAVKANPKHLEANQELRLIEMRRKNAPPRKGGGLFGR